MSTVFLPHARRSRHGCSCSDPVCSLQDSDGTSALLRIYREAKSDPSKTLTFRRQWKQNTRGRVNRLLAWLRKYVAEEDGLEAGDARPPSMVVQAFREKLVQKLDTVFPYNWTDSYVRQAYKQALRRGITEMKKAGYVPDSVEADDMTIMMEMNRPKHRDELTLRVEAAREEVRQQKANIIVRVMRIALKPAPVVLIAESTRRKNAIVAEVIKIQNTSIEAMAETETLTSYNAALLATYSELGATEVRARVEWLTAGDFKVCPDCAGAAGTQMRVEQAEGMIPLHPRCRCVWVPIPAPPELTESSRGQSGSRFFVPPPVAVPTDEEEQE